MDKKDRRLEGKAALITGAGSGQGRAAAIIFAKEGAKVSVVDNNSSSGTETVRIIKEAGGDAFYIQADVSKAADAEKMIETTVKNYGKLDILYNNAGIDYGERPISDTTEEDWDRLMDINLKGVFLGSKFAIPEMKKQSGGVIINTASNWGITASSGASAYCASKGGVISLTKALAMECAPHNIRVNAICPGPVETPMIELWYANKPHPERERQAIVQNIPLGRMARAEEIASLALFLASGESTYITGAALVIDGGDSIH